MIRVEADEQRMILPQHGAELWGYALRKENRDARANPQKFDVRYRTQTRQQIVKSLVTEQQRITSAEQHITHLGVVLDVLNLAVKLRMKVVSAGVADES